MKSSLLTSPNLLGSCYPYKNRGHFFGGGLNPLQEPMRLAQSPVVNYFTSDYPWGSDVFTDTNAVQRPAADEPHLFRRPFPMISDSVPSLLSSIFDSADNANGLSIPWVLGSFFQLVPMILSTALPTSNEPLGLGPVNEGRTTNAFADTLREAMAASREAGPSGSSASSLTLDIAPSPSSSTLLLRTYPSDPDSEQAEVDHAILMSSIEHVENSLHTLQANFVFPTRLDCHLPSNTNFHASGSIDEDTDSYIAAYLPITPVNSIVLDFVQDLRGLLHRLDYADSNNDMEANSMKEKVAGAISRVLEDVEGEVEEAIGKWMSLQATGADVVGR
ncbi:hypothetical protein BDM02DRAFT_3271192 [Thelephora ganbajun]|uniref:Uncharacterized protein n=1 Tax=Thelephora ganbajun TaxID=370292 RepID=A0ACB6Z952_THEGA|nr:hypothetical protein BDM02DRAFT_3271192 [Thelephora ganbajun]